MLVNTATGIISCHEIAILQGVPKKVAFACFLGADMIKNGRDLEDRMDFKFIAIVSKNIIDPQFFY